MLNAHIFCWIILFEGQNHLFLIIKVNKQSSAGHKTKGDGVWQTPLTIWINDSVSHSRINLFNYPRRVLGYSALLWCSVRRKQGNLTPSSLCVPCLFIFLAEDLPTCQVIALCSHRAHSKLLLWKHVCHRANSKIIKKYLLRCHSLTLLNTIRQPCNHHEGMETVTEEKVLWQP